MTTLLFVLTKYNFLTYINSYDSIIDGAVVRQKGILKCDGTYNDKEYTLAIFFVSEESYIPNPTYEPGSRKDKIKGRIKAYVTSNLMPFYHDFVRTNPNVIVKLDPANPKGVSLETIVNK